MPVPTCPGQVGTSATVAWAGYSAAYLRAARPSTLQGVSPDSLPFPNRDLAEQGFPLAWLGVNLVTYQRRLMA